MDSEGGGYLTVGYAYEGSGFDPRQSSSGISKDGSFTIEPLKPGKIYLTAGASLYGSAANAKYYVKSITLNGTDLTQHPLTIEAGQVITNVKIVLAADSAQAKIQLLDAAGKPVPAKPLVVVSVDPSKWSFDNQRAMGVTDVDGMLQFSGAPGEYLVLVAAKNDKWPPTSEGVRAALGTAARISLRPGDNKIIAVPVR
jgi:hypothetical protein